MNIQSLSVCVPARRCINDCVFCCSKMHEADYEDCFTDILRHRFSAEKSLDVAALDFLEKFKLVVMLNAFGNRLHA